MLAARRVLGLSQLRRTQPYASRRTRKPCDVGDRRVLPSAHQAQRYRLGVPSRPQGEARGIHGLLADDLAFSRAGDAADFWRRTRSAAAFAEATDATLMPFAEPESAPPEKPTIIRRGDVRIERIDRIGLELSTQGKSMFHVEEDDPLSAVAELRQTKAMSRDLWQVRIETQMRLSCTRDVFLLQGGLRAWEGAKEVCRREWDRSIPRDFI